MEKLSSDLKYYFIGFLQGDGSLNISTRNRGKLTIELSKKDRILLRLFKQKIEEVYPDIKISFSERTRDTNFKKDYKSSCLTICDQNFREEVSKYIPAGKKSKVISPPKGMNEVEKKHYIRGLTDADGSLGLTNENKPFWSLCTSSEDVKNFILDEIEKELGFRKQINRNKRDQVYNISLFNEDAVKWSSSIYIEGISLPRKFYKQKELSKWKRTTPKRKGRKKSWSKAEDNLLLSKEFSTEELVQITKRSISSIKIRIWRLSNNK